jgi:hypothetical protein
MNRRPRLRLRHRPDTTRPVSARYDSAPVNPRRPMPMVAGPCLRKLRHPATWMWGPHPNPQSHEGLGGGGWHPCLGPQR